MSANYLLNKVPQKKVDKTPYEFWKGRKPSYKYLKVWGCLAKVVVPTTKKMRIGPKTVDCIFIDYAQNNSAYRFLVHESTNPNIHKNTIIESRNTLFFEHIFPCNSKGDLPSSSKQPVETIEDNSQIHEDKEMVEEEPRRSKRARTKVFRTRLSDLYAGG